MGQLFWGVFKVPGAGVAPRPNMGAENWDFLKLLKTMIVKLDKKQKFNKTKIYLFALQSIKNIKL